MPRIARQFIISPHILYHITCRGNNQQNIFLSDRDKLHFFKRLDFYHQKFDFKLYCYVLMENHYHLLIETGEKHTISQIMQGINTSYALYFANKYNLKGHVLQGRYHCRVIDKDNYFLEVVRYIHLNPIKAGVVNNLRNFRWSSYHEYIGKSDLALVDKNEILELFGKTPENQIKRFREFLENASGEGTDTRSFYQV